MVHHSKDKVPRDMIERCLPAYFPYIGKNYEIIEVKNPVMIDSKGEEGIADGVYAVKDPLKIKNKGEPFAFNNEIQSGRITEEILLRSHGYANKAKRKYKMPVECFFLSLAGNETGQISTEVSLGEKFTADVLSLTDFDAEERLNRITDKIDNNSQLNQFDFLDLAFLPFMTSKIHSQVQLYELAVKSANNAKMDLEDKQAIIDNLYLYFDDFVKTEEDYETVQGDLMNKMRARYIQDEKEQSLKEGIMIGERNIISNLLKEFKDIDYIQKITKCPRSEIKKVAELAQ